MVAPPASLVDALVPPIEEIVKVVKTVLQEQISERIRKQIVDVHVSQVVAQATEVPKTSSRDRSLQCTAEQSLDVPVPEMVRQLVEVPKTVPQDRIRQRTVEQIVDVPFPQAVEELAEVFRVFSQDRIQQHAVEQTTSATSLVEMIVEMPVARTPEKTQQVANTIVQHAVNTVEVERPKIIKQTGQKTIIQEKINQVTKHVEVPQVQFLNKVDEMLVGVQRQIPMVQTAQKTMEIPQLQCIGEAIDDPVVQVSRVQVIERTVGIPQLQIVEKTAEDPQTQTIQGTQTSESLDNASFHQVAQAETVEVDMIEAPLPTESAVLVPVTVPKTLDSPRVQLIDKVVSIPVMAQRQVSSAPRVRKIVETVEVPQIQYVDKIVDAPVVAWTEDVSVGTQTVSREEKASFGD